MTMTLFRADQRVHTLRASLAAAPFHRARILRGLAVSSIPATRRPPVRGLAPNANRAG